MWDPITRAVGHLLPLACVLQTVRLFQMYGFKTSVLVSDGAASNLTTIKATMGVHGAFRMCSDKNDSHKVEPCFINPFNPPNKVYWIICPSHQVLPGLFGRCSKSVYDEI